jgi:hypothetical protein
MAIDGSWNVTMQSPMGPRPGKATFTAAGNDLSGTFGGDAGAVPLTGSVDGGNVKWSATVPGPMGEMNLQFSGALDGDNISGSVQFGALASGTFTAVRA